MQTCMSSLLPRFFFYSSQCSWVLYVLCVKAITILQWKKFIIHLKVYSSPKFQQMYALFPARLVFHLVLSFVHKCNLLCSFHRYLFSSCLETSGHPMALAEWTQLFLIYFVIRYLPFVLNFFFTYYSSHFFFLENCFAL